MFERNNIEIYETERNQPLIINMNYIFTTLIMENNLNHIDVKFEDIKPLLNYLELEILNNKEHTIMNHQVKKV
jgi:hypothetical protein